MDVIISLICFHLDRKVHTYSSQKISFKLSPIIESQSAEKTFLHLYITASKVFTPAFREQNHPSNETGQVCERTHIHTQTHAHFSHSADNGFG